MASFVWFDAIKLAAEVANNESKSGSASPCAFAAFGLIVEPET